MAPALALRGPDGSLHDAILGMQKWTSFVIILFLSSLLLYAAAPTIAISSCHLPFLLPPQFQSPFILR